jgi:23S rRNA (uracil1939-C5)-methyltransferase
MSSTGELQIERVGAQGDGVALGSRGQAVFVPLTLPGERVEVAAEGERAELVRLIEPSAERTVPPCPHFGACGGCALQHWAREPYSAWKVEQIRQALGRQGIETELAAAFTVAPGSRRRVALHARRVGREIVLGFKGRRSWSVVPIETCVIADPRIVAALPALRRLARPFLEHPKSAPILHTTLTATGLDVDVSGVEAKGGGLSADARVRAAEAAGAADLARLTLAGEMLYLARLPMVRFGAAAVPLPPGGFLQAAVSAERRMVELVVTALDGAPRVADLFCGAGAFTFPIAERSSVLALDSARDAIASLIAGRAGAQGLKAIEAEARDLFRRPLLAPEMKKLDAVVFDPPRAGALEQVGEVARSGIGLAVAVSCNAQTFARDAAVLIGAGFRLECVWPIDQFLWSPHMELVGVFRR